MATYPPALNESIFGGVIASDVLRPPAVTPSKENKKSTPGETNPAQQDGKTSPMLMVISIIITLIVFVVAIAYFDIVREKIVYRRTMYALRSDLIAPTEKDRKRIKLIADETYSSAKEFAVTVTIIAFILLPPLFYAYQRI